MLILSRPISIAVAVVDVVQEHTLYLLLLLLFKITHCISFLLCPGISISSRPVSMLLVQVSNFLLSPYIFTGLIVALHTLSMYYTVHKQ